MTFDEGELSVTLEELGRFTWMLIAACVVLFIASLPGGMFTVLSVSLGIGLMTGGRMVYLRSLQEARAKPDPELAERGAARQLVQAKLMREAFGKRELIKRGRKLEEIELSPYRRWLLTRDGVVCAVLFELRDEGFVLARGELLCTDLRPGQALPRLWRLELLPQTGRVLSWSGLGGDAPARELACDDATRAWLETRGEFGSVVACELPSVLAKSVGAATSPYRNA